MDTTDTARVMTPPVTIPIRIAWRAPGDGALNMLRKPKDHSLWTLPVLGMADALSLRQEIEHSFARDGPTDRGVRLKTDDLVLTSLAHSAQTVILNVLRTVVLPFAYAVGLARAGTHVPPLSKIFIVRYSDLNPRTAKLDLHTDDLDFTVTMALSEPEEYDGGGTFFPAEGDACKAGFLLRPRIGESCCLAAPRAPTKRNPIEHSQLSPLCTSVYIGTCIMHDGQVLHAGYKVVRGTRYLLVAFFEGGGVSEPLLRPSFLIEAKLKAERLTETYIYPDLSRRAAAPPVPLNTGYNAPNLFFLHAPRPRPFVPSPTITTPAPAPDTTQQHNPAAGLGLASDAGANTHADPPGLGSPQEAWVPPTEAHDLVDSSDANQRDDNNYGANTWRASIERCLSPGRCVYNPHGSVSPRLPTA